MSLPISDTSKVASSHATVATRHKGPLKDGKDLVGEMWFNLEPEELLSMCFVCIMNEEALGRPIVVNILVRHRQFFSFWRTARANCMDLALASPAEYEPVSRRIRSHARTVASRRCFRWFALDRRLTVSQPRSMRLCISKRHAKH